MPHVPIVPRLKRYSGAKENLRRKASDFNRMAHRVADHVNTLMANNPSEIQQYLFHDIATDLGLTVDEVRQVMPGGYHGITVGVREQERQALARYTKLKPQQG